MYKVKGGEAFHMIALKAPVCGIVYLFEIGLVSERRIPGKPHYGSLGTVIPFPCKKHGKESVRRHGLWSGTGKKMCQKEPNPESLLSDFGVFRLSKSWEMQPMAFFILPNIGKIVFR